MKPYVFSKEKTPDSQSGRFLLLRICFVKSVFTNFSIFDLCQSLFYQLIIYYLSSSLYNYPRFGE